VVEAANLLSVENNGLLHNPKVNVVIDDGRNYIMTARRKWPVIISDSTHPKSGDSWVLYTQEFYRLVREHLTDDGVFVEWVPMHGLTTAEYKIIVRTFQSVFPHASMWITVVMDEQGRSGAYSLLAATPQPLKIDVARLRDRLNAEPVRRDLEPFGLHTPAGFLDSFLCAEEKLRQWAGEGPVNTDNFPLTQYQTRYSKVALLNNANLIEPMEDIWPYLTGTGPEQEAKHLHEELVLRAEAVRLALMGQLGKAYAVLPDDVRYQQMRRLYEDRPRYIQTLVGIYWDNPKVLDFLAGLIGNVQATAPIYERIIKLDGKNVWALNMLAVARVNEGRLQEAEEYLRRAVRLAPDFADAHDNLGVCLAKQGRLKEAITPFERAVELRPESITARVYLAHALYQAGRIQEALPHLHYILKMDPENKTAIGILTQIEGRGAAPPGQ
jgi:spermidine synthase